MCVGNNKKKKDEFLYLFILCGRNCENVIKVVNKWYGTHSLYSVFKLVFLGWIGILH